MRTLLVLLCLLAAPLPGWAIYKCEANGKITYSDARCKGAHVTELDENLGADLGDPAGARWQLEQQKAELKRLEHSRLKHAAKEEKKQQQLARAVSVQQKKCARLAQRKRWSEEDALRAQSRPNEKLQLKAKRMEELYQLECGK